MATAKKPLTLGDLPKKLSSLKTNQILYTLLLVAVFFIGYLLARVQMLEAGVQNTNTVATAPDTQAAPQEPPAPDPEEVLKTLTLGHLPVRGDENAKVTIVEFSDFECPFCERFFTDTLPQIEKDYIDTGKVKLYYRQFPLDFHPAAKPAALASECANEQGKFWQFHDTVFKNQEQIAGGGEKATEALKGFAKQIGLNTTQFDQCFDSAKFETNVTGDSSEGQSVAVSGTPTFYINGRQIVGAQPYTAFKAIIDEELSK